MVSVPADVARAHRAVEPLHSQAYSAPEQDQHLTAIGLRPGRMCYVAGRAAAMGAVGAGVVTAAFATFTPALVARHLPRAWALAAPEQVVVALGRQLSGRLAAAGAYPAGLLAGR